MNTRNVSMLGAIGRVTIMPPWVISPSGTSAGFKRGIRFPRVKAKLLAKAALAEAAALVAEEEEAEEVEEETYETEVDEPEKAEYEYTLYDDEFGGSLSREQLTVEIG